MINMPIVVAYSKRCDMINEPIKRLVILGGGTAGWLSALTFKKAFGNSLDIELVESEEVGIVGVGEATIPPIRELAHYLDLDEDEVMRETQGTFKLGIEFVDWYQKSQSYGHWFGAIGHPLGILPFYQYWLKLYKNGIDTSLWDYILNAKAAKKSLMARMPVIPNSPLEGLTYAWHFDAALFGLYLRNKCTKAGVIRTEGYMRSVTLNPDSGNIEALHLSDDRIIAGDFFIDCSGFSALLLGKTCGVGYKSYSEWLRVDAALAIPTKSPDGPLLPYTKATAHDAGWQWRIPLQHRVGNGHVFSTSYTSIEAAHNKLLTSLDAPTLGDPRLIRFSSGRRDLFWSKNCVGLGLASGFLEPLESTSIHMVQSGLMRLLTLFPDKSINPVLRDQYNKRTEEEYEWVRDFIILHYHATTREDTTFWREMKHMPIPDSLKNKIEIFTANGLIATQTDDLFRTSSWVQVLLGQGIIPKRSSAATALIENKNLSEYFDNISSIQTNSLRLMADHRHFIDQNCKAKQIP